MFNKPDLAKHEPLSDSCDHVVHDGSHSHGLHLQWSKQVLQVIRLTHCNSHLIFILLGPQAGFLASQLLHQHQRRCGAHARIHSFAPAGCQAWPYGAGRG